jgi:hypothetical protein
LVGSCYRVKAQATRRTVQTPPNRPGWKLEGAASGTRMWRQHTRGGAALGGSRRLEAGVRLVEHPAVEADARALVETRLSPKRGRAVGRWPGGRAYANGLLHVYAAASSLPEEPPPLQPVRAAFGARVAVSVTVVPDG